MRNRILFCDENNECEMRQMCIDVLMCVCVSGEDIKNGQ